MINVREACLSDVDSIVRLGEELQQNSSYAHKGFCADKANKMVSLMLESESDNAFVAEDEREVIGYFLGGVNDEWFSDDLLGFDYSVYVTPSKRNGRAAIKLFKAFETWAKAKGAISLHVGITTNINVQGCRRLYHFLGYEDGGIFFEKRL